MTELMDIMIYNCPECGRPTEEPGLCPKCSGLDKKQGDFKACRPPSCDTDCDCPVIGYTKVHAPWCKYF